MADIKPSTYLIGVVMFTFFITAGVYIIGEFGVSDSEDLERFNNTFNKYSDVDSSISQMQESVTDASTRTGTLGVINSLIDSVWNSILLWFDSFSFMKSAFDGLATFFGVPTFVPGMIMMLVTIILVFAIYRLLFQADA